MLFRSREWRLYQFLGRESRYFRCEFWESEAAARTFWDAPERRAHWASLTPEAWRRPQSVDLYHVLLQLGDPRLG